MANTPSKPAKKRYPSEKALPVAQELVNCLTPYCARIVVAGSLRRGLKTVGDIELLCVPDFQPYGQIDIWGKTGLRNELDHRVEVLMEEKIFKARPNTRGFNTLGAQNKLLIHVPSGLPIDIFSTKLENWGMALFVRTGPAAWNKRAMQRFRDIGKRGHAYGGVTHSDGEQVDCPDEETVFAELKWDYVTPERRGESPTAS